MELGAGLCSVSWMVARFPRFTLCMAMVSVKMWRLLGWTGATSRLHGCSGTASRSCTCRHTASLGAVAVATLLGNHMASKTPHTLLHGWGSTCPTGTQLGRLYRNRVHVWAWLLWGGGRACVCSFVTGCGWPHSSPFSLLHLFIVACLHPSISVCLYIHVYLSNTGT